MNFLFFIVCFSLIFLSQALRNGTLQLVAEFFRHGAREVVYDYWNSNEFYDWGALTPVGMRQHYVLGTTLRKRYIEDLQFLSPNYLSSEMYVRSTDVNRTLRSALSQLYGFYPLTAGPYIPIGIPSDLLLPPWNNISTSQNLYSSALPGQYQPFAIHTRNSKYEYLLTTYSSTTCPGNNQLQTVWEKTSSYQSMVTAFQPTFQAAAKLLNLTTNISFFGAYAIMDVFQDDIYYNKPIPNNISSELWKNLTFAYDIDMYLELYGSDNQRKLVSTPFFQELTAIFQQNIQGNSTYKWHMYSAHDTTIGQCLVALNLTTYQCIYEIFTTGKTTANACIYQYPNFATSLIVELYQDNIGRYVKVLYNNVYQPLCNSQSTECDYNEFVMRMQNYMLSEPDFQSLCQTGQLPSEREDIKKSQAKIDMPEENILENIYQFNLTQKRPLFQLQIQQEPQQNEDIIKTFIIILQLILIIFIAFKLKSSWQKKKDKDAQQLERPIFVTNYN